MDIEEYAEYWKTLLMKKAITKFKIDLLTNELPTLNGKIERFSGTQIEIKLLTTYLERLEEAANHYGEFLKTFGNKFGKTKISVFSLAFIYGKSDKEIANVCDISLSCVKKIKRELKSNFDMIAIKL